MLDGRAVDLDACRDMGIAMFAGEAEGRLDLLLRDAAGGRLAAVYDFMKELPGMEGTPVPFLPKRYVARTLGLSASFDAGRGCPCDFVSIHAYNRSRLMADKLARTKEMALEIDADYYANLWINSHESCPGWDLPPDPAYADSYLGNAAPPPQAAPVQPHATVYSVQGGGTGEPD